MNRFYRLSLHAMTFIILAWPATSEGQDTRSGYMTMTPPSGYVITLAGDTIVGKITYGKQIEKFTSEINFTGPDSKTVSYTAADLTGMGVSQSADRSEIPPFGSTLWDNYECRPSPKNEVMVFMKKLSDGRMKIFYNPGATIISIGDNGDDPIIDGINFTYSPGDGLYCELVFATPPEHFEKNGWYSSYYVEKDGSARFKVEKRGFDTVWKDLFGDCRKMSEEVDHNPGLLKFRNFLIVAEIYNRICNSY